VVSGFSRTLDGASGFSRTRIESSMKISLLYNPDAGEGLSLRAIRNALERAGHQLVSVVDKQSDSHDLFEKPCDLVVAAGGDGTVSAAARLLVGLGIPLGILPLGTANNIALSLGITDDIEVLIARWEDARRFPLDMGVASGAWGTKRVVEAVGGGLIPAAIKSMNARPMVDEMPLPTKLARTARRYREVLASLRPRPWTMTLDGVRIRGDFLLVEALNTALIGPNLALYADASPSDGLLNVVTVGEEHREELESCLQRRSEGKDCRLSLSSVRARDVTFQCESDIHVDDTCFAQPANHLVSIHIEPAAVEYLK
jgi:diacylglycerol kinase (ATP)